jgi:carbon-monoxide dehydrogenase large subunit
LRKEDRRLLTGAGCYSADCFAPDQVHAVVVRSPHAHAAIRSIDTLDALRMPGVHAVLTGADYAADGLKPLPHTPLPFSPPDISLEGREGISPRLTQHVPLPNDRARFVGEGIAVVIAETLDAAKDGADAVVVEYEELPAAVHVAQATRNGATLIWPDFDSNVCVDVAVGDAEATEAAFRSAAHVVQIDTWIPRVTAVPMEPRAVLATFDGDSGQYTLHAGAGGVVRLRRDLAGALNVPEERVRVSAGDIGGNFGSKNATSPEYPMLLWASRRVGRPVSWVCERRESFLSDYQGRDLAVSAELALDRTGKFLALRGSNTSNVGAYVASLVPLTKGVETMTGVYDIPHAHFRARAVFTNTPPTYPYRSAGRPEAMFVIERLIDMAASQFGFDRVELRRKNLIHNKTAPYANPLGITYDPGSYADTMELALEAANWSTFKARQREARRRGKLRGIAVSNYIEVTGGAPRERADIDVRQDGVIEVAIGTLSSGQGHETSFAQLLGEWLHVPLESVRLVTGDTNRITIGGGSHAGRSMRFATIVVARASTDLVAKAKKVAAFLFDCPECELQFGEGGFSKAKTDRVISLFEIAAASKERTDLPLELRGPLTAAADETRRSGAFPYGCQVCEVEVDVETGSVELVGVVAVDDVGCAINPMILHGQTHGGFVQGAGQALMEKCHYDQDSGQLLSASFMDYAMPRATSVPNIHARISETPSPEQPIGVRAGGEGGTTPALAAICNAVVNALSSYGVTHLELPITSPQVWRAIQAGNRNQAE